VDTVLLIKNSLTIPQANQKKDEHGQQGGPFKDTTFNLRCLEDLEKRCGKGITDCVNKVAKTG